MFIKEPGSVIGNSGDRVSVECEVDSNPGARYQWIRDNLSSGDSNNEVRLY